MGPTGGWTVERSVVEEVRFERYEDFRRWVADRPGYWILVQGVPMPSPSPSRKHQAVSLRFQLLLVDAVLRRGRGEVYHAPFDVKLREDTVYQPDLLVVLREHADRLRETHVEGAPDLIVEILSPSTAHLDLWQKRYDYATAGVREYWIADPDTRRVELYVLEGERLVLAETAQGQGRLRSRLLPDLAVDLEALFRDL
jgi:Uma2 family endonuclease